jgi:hypothetical protein
MFLILPYQYQPFAPGEIQLLQIFPPTSEAQNNPIRFHIVHVIIERCDVPESFFTYEALSCVWGGERTETVYCDNCTFKVTPNLVSALSRLRQTMPMLSFHRTLWADSIRIDQDDVIERGHQVRLMRDIYSHAAKVIVWLGSDLAVARNLDRIKYGYLPAHELEDGWRGESLRNSYFCSWGKVYGRSVTRLGFRVFAAKVLILGGPTSIDREQRYARVSTTLQAAFLSRSA